jgi:hypothetical protein
MCALRREDRNSGPCGRDRSQLPFLWQSFAGEALLHSLRDERGDRPTQGAYVLWAGGTLCDSALLY